MLTSNHQGILFESSIFGPSAQLATRQDRQIFFDPASNQSSHGVFVGPPQAHEEDIVNVVMTSPVDVISVSMEVLSGEATNIVMFDAAYNSLYNETVSETDAA